MKSTFSAAILLAALLTFTASSLIFSSVSAQTGCAGTSLEAAVTTGSWSSDCLSPNRPDDTKGPGAGDYYARYYHFYVDQRGEVTITLESDTDTYLYLLTGAGRNGTVIADNDDIDRAARNYNSRIVWTLDPGDYSIEATTYWPERSGGFTLTIDGNHFDTPASPQPSPTATTEPTPGASPVPSPTPTPELPDCVESLPDDMTDEGTWSADCTSSEATSGGDRYARFYAFSLDSRSDVTINLSSEEDTLLFLRRGTTTDGTAPYSNDDIDRANQNYNSRISERLDAGTYTIEATTYHAARTGAFTLTVSITPVSGTTTPSPSPGPSPSPTPPDTTSPIPDGCSLQTFSGTSFDGSWSSGCVSQNRTDNGDHYAKFFSFSVSRTSTVDLTLVSETDPYLILLDSDGNIVDQNDDVDEEGNVFGIEFPNSGIRISLDPGSYIVEATTYEGAATGSFILTITYPEQVALEALYNATDGDNWTNNDNWMSGEPFSDWHGVTTDDEGRVTEIYLISNNLDGEIPEELGKLSRLEGLYLARNELSGSIPPELGDLSNLEVLMLFSNELTGSIPDEFGDLHSLEELHMGRNELSGSIPSQIGDLANLRRLHLTVNDLSGSIPSSLGNLTNLRQISIGANDLTGSIPAEIADLSELTHIYLWGNDLSGGTFVGNLDMLTKLQWLDVGGNQIDGSDVLAEIDALTELTGLGIHDSDLTDTDLQDHMDDLRALDLEFLNVSSNGLDDLQTLAQLSRITTIQRLAINGNDFSGELPSSMTNLTLMRLFYFHDNNGLCAPDDDDFQDWLDGIADVRADENCAGSSSSGASASSSAASGQVAALQSSTGTAMQEDSLTLQDLQ